MGEIDEPFGWTPWDPVCEPQVPQPVSAEPVWPMQVGAELTKQQVEVLEFEARWWRRPGAKDQAIRERFGVSTVRYYQLVNRLADSPAAAAYDPVLVARLLRIRARRR